MIVAAGTGYRIPDCGQRIKTLNEQRINAVNRELRQRIQTVKRVNIKSRLSQLDSTKAVG